MVMCRVVHQEASHRSPDAGRDQCRDVEAIVELEALHTQQKQQVEEMRKELVDDMEGLGLASV